MALGARPWRYLSLCLVLLIAFSPTCLAIVVSDDPDLHEVTAPCEYDMVGYLSSAGGTSGVLIDAWHVLTAKHAVNGYTSGTFALDLPGGRQTYNWTSSGVFMHPTADLAVVTLTSTTGTPGYGLYRATDELYKECIMVGYGMSGTGDSVAAGGDPAYPRGTKRVGYNNIDRVGSSIAYKYFQMDFDHPDFLPPDPNSSSAYLYSLGAAKEAMFALGDSGGPSFIRSGDDLLVAGIHVSVSPRDPAHWPAYGDPTLNNGDRGTDIRISAYTSWLDPFIYTPIPGDANYDALVSVADLGILATNYGMSSGALWCQGNFNDDGKVDLTDLAILSSHYGQSCDIVGRSAAPALEAPDALEALDAPVPEPATMGLLLFGGLFVLWRWRR